MLAALFKLVDDGCCTLPQAARLVTINPARAVRMTGYGELAAGNVADLILVQNRSPQEHVVRIVIVDGQVRLTRGASD
jgi:alpha-D-ribose 1-methylphosphonate 5-triphosphate diphosphatase PhnM